MVVAAVMLASTLHWLTPAGVHQWHWVHVVAAKFYYVPIVLAAAWFQPGMVVAVVATISIITAAHVVRDWSGSMMLQTEQLAEILNFWIVGFVSATLFWRERQARRRTREAHGETLMALAGSLELRERYTAGHSHRVRDYAVLLAHEMGCREPAFLSTLAKAALLHDVGKIAVPDRVLLKPGPLTPDEWALMRRHPESGATLIGNIPSLSTIRELILAHHERFDGRGYPGGRRGEEIPIGARIFGVADTFDALTTARPYRKAQCWEQAARTIAAGRGTQFDPDVVDAFLRVPYATWARAAVATGTGLWREQGAGPAPAEPTESRISSTQLNATQSTHREGEIVMRTFGVGIVIAVVAVASSGCGGDGSMGGGMMGPSSTGQTSMMTGGDAGISMIGVSPAGGSSGVASTGPIEIRFSGAMPGAVGFQVDLHLGDLSGPTVAITCVASADRTRLSCSPATALQAGTRYVTHVGGGTVGSFGCGSNPSTMMGGQYNPSTMMGGQWVGGGGMSTSTHGGMSWGGMGGWVDGCGGYGMAFPFTTA